MGQLNLQTSRVIRDELGVIIGATKVTKHAARTQAGTPITDDYSPYTATWGR